VKYERVTTSSVVESHGSIAAKESRVKKLLAELRQMSRVSDEQLGLLNHPQAAAVLEVSARRVAELVELGKLTRHNFLGRTYVSVREVLERREADVKAGRPPRSIGQRIRAAAKVVRNYDPLNAAIDVVTPEPKKRKQKPK
jgi:hypothetical protein